MSDDDSRLAGDRTKGGVCRAGSLAGDAGMSCVWLEVTEAVLNHVSSSRGGIVGVYQRHA